MIIRLTEEMSDEDWEKFNELMDEMADANNAEVESLSFSESISWKDASAIVYVRSRSWWTQEKENYLIQLAKDDKPLPNVCQGDFGADMP